VAAFNADGMTQAQIIVTGANGQVGLALRRALSHDKTRKYKFLGRNELNICDGGVAKTIRKYPAVGIINLAAMTDVDHAERNPKEAFSVNADAVKGLVDIADGLNIPMIQMSTDYVFGGQIQGGYLEEDAVCPVNIYGKAKAKAEQIIMDSGINYYLIRSGWIFSDSDRCFPCKIASALMSKSRVNVVNDQFGTPTSADSLARFLLKIGDSFFRQEDLILGWGVYHFGQTPSVSRYDLAKYVRKDLIRHTSGIPVGTLSPCKSDFFPVIAKRPINTSLNTNKLAQAGVDMSIPWFQDLEKVLQSFVHNYRKKMVC
jgi:dTDP-4-dehydrorhamnose reductase